MKTVNSKKRVLVTSALPYVNNIPHLGNVVGSHLPADIFARYCRLKGYDVVFVGGSDEHGTPIELAAEKKKTSPKELTDYYYSQHKRIYDWFNFSYDNFSRTSRVIHHKTARDIFLEIYKKGWILEKTLQQPYCLNCKRFLADRYIEGICPVCGNEKARGDQCEKCGTVLDPIKLINPRCAICGLSEVEFREVPHLFFDYPKASKKLEKWISSKKNWRKQVREEALGWIKEGLQPRAITRDLKWGIKVPLKGYEDKVFYVWFEAPIGYISSTKEKFPKTWKKYWLEKDTKIYHFLAKDNVPFHAIFWPATLMADGRFNLPYDVVGLQYLNYEGAKFSKSKNWGVFCENLPDAGLAPDYWRYYLANLIPETGDTDFKWQEFKDKVNGELIGNLGNFVHRTLSMIDRNFNGKISLREFKPDPDGRKIMQEIKMRAKETDKFLAEVKIRDALRSVLELASAGNRYIDKKAPWLDIKDGKNKNAQKTLWVCLNLCRSLAILSAPFLPDFFRQVLEQIGVKLKSGIWETAGVLELKKIHKTGEPKIIFNKLDDADLTQVRRQVEKITAP